MDGKILRLLKLIEIYNDGVLNPLLRDEFKAFADTENYKIETIEDLIKAMEDEMSYWNK